MNILFLFQTFSFEESTIYKDLVCECAENGHSVFILAGTSKEDAPACVVEINGCKTAYVKLPDQFKAGKIKKGLVQLLIEPIFISSLKKHFGREKIDIVAYPTPPITLAGVVAFAKRHFGAKTYLMLKDIFPQNAADLNMMKEGGLIFKYFKWIEKRLYAVSSVIGCMSQANIDYMKKHNPETAGRLVLFPNTVRIKYIIEEAPEEEADSGSVKFVFGGNLGRPQALDFLLPAMKRLWNEKYTSAEFLIIGEGTERCFVEKYIEDNKLKNVTFYNKLPRDEYEALLKEQDIGIISLSPRFTIPNFPSRLLSYMQMAKPVLVVTDTVSDMGKTVLEAGCGFYCPSSDENELINTIKTICENKKSLKDMGAKGNAFLRENYDVKLSVKLLEQAVL